MAMRILSREATLRMLELAKNKTPPPLKIVEQQARIERATKGLAEQLELTGAVPQEEVATVVKMKLVLDSLYARWAEGKEFIRWVDIPAKTDITPAQIIEECMFSTESIKMHYGVDTLAEFLDFHGCEGILRELAKQYLAEARPLLEEALAFDEATLTIFDDPRQYFGVSDDDVVVRCITDYFKRYVNRDSPEHVKEAMIAHTEFSIHRYGSAIFATGNALSEKIFAQDPSARTTRRDEVILQIETHKAELLIDLLKQRRTAHTPP